MKKIILIIVTGIILFIASISAAAVVNNKIKNTKYDLIVKNSAGGSVVVDIDGETTDIPSGDEKTILVKRKTKVKLSATADEKYNFAGWKIGSSNESSEEITLTITSKTEVKAKYESKAVNVTVDGETLSYGIAYNLLEFLQQAFPADAGYTKSYFIGNTKITETTEISADTQITSKQEAITYYVTFMHNNKQVGQKVPYTVENKNVVAPTLPSEAGYSLTWPNITKSLNELKDFSVYSVKTPIEYTATFKYKDEVVAEIKFNITNKDNLVAPAVPTVAAGYKAEWAPYTLGLENATIQLVVSEIEYTVTFIHDNKKVEELTYTINNKNISAPAAPVETGYDIKWEEFSIEDKLENIVVKSIKTATVYTVTFKHNGEIVATEEYSAEDKNITVPAVPAVDGYTVVWDVFSLDNLGNIVVNSVKTAIKYTVTFKHNGEIVATEEYSAEDKNITVPAVPAVDGYTVVWDEFSLDNLGNIVVNSIKTPIKYTVTFKHNDKVVATEEYSAEDKNITVPAVPAVDGYTVVWDEFSLDNLGNIVVNSIKTPIDYTIFYTQAADANQLTGLTEKEVEDCNNKTTYNCETATFTLENPTRIGYTFIGWSLNSETEKQLFVTIELGSTGNKIFTAHWEKNTATICLGTLENVEAIYYGTSADDITNELTESGFSAQLGTNYFFKAILATEKFHTITFDSFTNWFEDTTNPSKGHQVAEAGVIYTIGAKAKKAETVYATCAFNYTGDLYNSNGFTDGDLVTIESVQRRGVNFYYIDGITHEEKQISIAEFAEKYFDAVEGAHISEIVDPDPINGSKLVTGITSAKVLEQKLLELTFVNDEITLQFVYDQTIAE